MSNIKPTLRLQELSFENECSIDILVREEELGIQIAAPDGRIIQRVFEALKY